MFMTHTYGMSKYDDEEINVGKKSYKEYRDEAYGRDYAHRTRFTTKEFRSLPGNSDERFNAHPSN